MTDGSPPGDGRPPLTHLTALKLVLAGVGVGVFGWGIRSDQSSVRWIGTALIAAAAALRFIRRSERR